MKTQAASGPFSNIFNRGGQIPTVFILFSPCRILCLVGRIYTNVRLLYHRRMFFYLHLMFSTIFLNSVNPMLVQVGVVPPSRSPFEIPSATPSMLLCGWCSTFNIQWLPPPFSRQIYPSNCCAGESHCLPNPKLWSARRNQ